MAFIPGKSKAKEFIAIAGHYDHLGVNGNKIFYGADDNCFRNFGNAFSCKSFRRTFPKKYLTQQSILFLAFGAEEAGLIGSSHYVLNPIVPIKQIKALINFDMVGRLNRQSIDIGYTLYVIASKEILGKAVSLKSQINADFVFDGTYGNINNNANLYSRSDHYPFARLGVPFIFYFSGFHEDYHFHTDTIEKINLDGLEKLTEFNFKLLWDLANE